MKLLHKCWTNQLWLCNWFELNSAGAQPCEAGWMVLMDVNASWDVFSVYKSSDSGISSGSRGIVGIMRGTPSEIQPWAVRLKVGRLAVGSCSSGYFGGFRSISGTLKVIPRGAFSKPPYGVATLPTKHPAFKFSAFILYFYCNFLSLSLYHREDYYKLLILFILKSWN